MSIFFNENFPNIRLHLITGPMFSGKTTKLINFVDDYLNSSKDLKCDIISSSSTSAENLSSNYQNKTLIFKYFFDNRYSSNQISTHTKVMRPAISCQSLVPHLKECEDMEVVAIDEGQFFDDLTEFISLLISSRKTSSRTINSSPIPLDIIIDSLDGDFLRHPFGKTLDLIPICTTFVKLRTLWKHDNETVNESDSLFKINGSPFSFRTVKSSKIKLIGGEESYKAATRSEYMKQSQAFISTENKDKIADSQSLSSDFGFVSIFIGRKKSGKTKELIKKIFEIEFYNSNHSENEKKTAILISTDTESISQNFVKCKTTQTLPSFSELSNFDCILIDDFHLYSNSAELCDSLANNGKYVFASGLSSDENNKLPAEVKLLIPMSESVIFLGNNLELIE